MATVRKAKYIYKDGTYFEVGGDGVDQAARDAAATAQATADSKAAIDDTAPSATSVYSSDKVEQEITAAVADFVSFSEDQTSRTDAEKAQARANINAEKPWVKVWENASPANNFSAQTVPLDLNNYTEVMIQYWRPFVNQYEINSIASVWGRVGQKIFMQLAYYQLTWRSANVTATGITFSTGYLTTAMNQTPTTAASYAVPVRIYAR